MKAFRTAVELDEYISSLTQDERDALRPSWNVAYQDQLDAASKQSVDLAEQILGHKAQWVPHKGIIEWVRLGMLDAMLKWFNGEALTCIHRPSPNKPSPVFAAAWKPGVVVCGYCSDMLSVSGTPADTICDGCGHECKGLPEDGIMPFVTFTGSFGYQAGVCYGCHDDMLRTQKASQ